MRQIALGLVLAIAAAAAPAHADDDGREPDLEVPGLAAADLRGDALVWEDATFFLEPWTGGAQLKFATFGSGRRDQVGRAIPVRILGSTMRTLVEIELVDRVDCAARRVSVDDRLDGLRLYVKRSDLAPVLVRPYRATFADGTSARLATGVPVMPVAGGRYAVAMRNEQVRLAIPHASVGYVYARGPAPEPVEPAGRQLRVERGTSVAFAGESITLRSPLFAPEPATPDAPARIPWRTRCVDLVIGIPAGGRRTTTANRVVPPPPSARGLIGGAFHVLPGTPLATRGGHEIAVAGREFPLGPSTDPVVCFEPMLVLERNDDWLSPVHRTLQLCTAAENLR